MLTAEPYTDYSPFAITAGENESCVRFASFNECLDAYFINEENVKVAEKVQKWSLSSRLTCRSKEAIDKKVLTINQKQEERIRILDNELRAVSKRVSALFNNASIVNTAIVVVNQFLSQGVQWDVLQEQVRQFKQKPYNVFHHIKSLDLEHNRMKMEFDDDEESEESDEENDSENDDNEEHRINVDVELSLNCNNNIALLYKQKKEIEEKLVRALALAHA